MEAKQTNKQNQKPKPTITATITTIQLHTGVRAIYLTLEFCTERMTKICLVCGQEIIF